MVDVLTYLFWPNPGGISYANPRVLALLVFCGFLVAASFGIRRWRSRLRNAVTKKLSATWPGAVLWLGVLGLLLVVSRVEGIQFLAMRFLWFVWGTVALLYIMFQAWKFRARHYEILPVERSDDPLKKYLPSKRKR